MKKTGYIAHHFPGTEEQNNLLNEVAKNLNEHGKHLLAHILNSQIINGDISVPIAARLVQEKLPKTKLNDLVKNNIIYQTRAYCKDAGISREYLVNPEIYKAFMNLEPYTITDILKGKTYNLCTGKIIKRKKPSKTKFTDKNRHQKFSDIQKESVKNIQSCRINVLAVNAFMETKKKQVILNGNQKNDLLSLQHDINCLSGIVDRAIKINDDFIIYQSTWESQSSGRITELGGGIQNASAGLKAAMIENTGYINLDIKSSQVAGAETELRKCLVDTSWFDYYREIGKERMAEKIGISVSNWKGILCSILMGGFPLMTKSGNFKAKTIVDLLNYECVRRYICPEVGLTVEWNFKGRFYNYYATKGNDLTASMNMFAILKAVHKECKGLIDGINQWHDLLFYSDWVAIAGSFKRPDFIATNKADCRLNLTEFTKHKPNAKSKEKANYNLKSEGKRKLAAHILQGKEAAFIHYITSFSDDFGFTVVSNQHDGLIIDGNIPLELIQNAKDFAGFPNAELIEKSIN